MKIKIEEGSDHYRADCVDLPGSPPIGLGKTPELAMAHLFWMMLFSRTGGNYNELWHNFVEQQDPITVNGVEWELPESYRKR